MAVRSVEYRRQNLLDIVGGDTSQIYEVDNYDNLNNITDGLVNAIEDSAINVLEGKCCNYIFSFI